MHSIVENTPYVSHSPDETCALATQFAECVHKGDIIFLVGEIGTGKTTFTQAFAKALGVTEVVNSPSFKLVNEYHAHTPSGALKIYHLDLYRLSSADDVAEIGWETYMSPDGITIVEWAERGKDLWIDTHWEIYFSFVDECTRTIMFCRK